MNLRRGRNTRFAVGCHAFRESIDLAEERIGRRWPRAREWLPLHL
ncbi:MAG TPA: hypothetical protein VN727_00535 [Candidatus Binatia bacterium]|nr:hypothetical protein [Candidatus Binatia bacterium]